MNAFARVDAEASVRMPEICWQVEIVTEREARLKERFRALQEIVSENAAGKMKNQLDKAENSALARVSELKKQARGASSVPVSSASIMALG